MREGQVVLAKVVAVHDYGVDVESEGKEGFVQPTELSWDPQGRAVDIVRAGESIEVLVYAMTPERFFASVKQAQPERNPWRDPGVFAPGSHHRGEVVDVLDWGASVRITNGVLGMILGSPESHGLHSKDPVSVVIESTDPARQAISLRLQL